MLTIAGLLIAPLLATAPTHPPKKAPIDSASMTLVVVQNDRTEPVTLYVQNDDTEIKLGVIGALADTTLRIPDYLTESGEVSFFVHPAHSADEGTSAMPIERGDHVGLIVPQKVR